MNLGMQDAVAIVTGGAKGIGEAITRTLAREGARTVIFGRNEQEAAALVDELAAHGHSAISHHVELTDFARVRTAIDEVANSHGRIDILVNNAGVNDGIGVDAGPEAFEASLRRNLTQIYAVTHYALPHLRRSQGCVVNIGSKVATTGQGGTSGYAAAKGGLNSLTREWALDLAADQVRVNTVVPAEVLTPLYERFLESRPDPEKVRALIEAHIPLGHRFTTAREIADMVAFLASPLSAHTTGQIIYVDGGYTHLDRMYEKLPPAR